MLYVPAISDYKPFYIQTGNSAIDIREVYKVIVKTHDYPMSLKVKEPYKNQWKDEHGDDEYIPQGGLKLEAFTFKMECVMFAKGGTLEAAIGDLKSGVTAFRNAILAAGMFKTFDSWTGWGFQQVRVQEFPTPTSDDYGAWRDYARVVFSVTLKVNDPFTNMVLSNGQIVEG